MSEDDGFDDSTTMNSYRLIGFVDATPQWRVGLSVARYDNGGDPINTFGAQVLYTADPLRIEASYERLQDENSGNVHVAAEYDLTSALTLRGEFGRSLTSGDGEDGYSYSVGADYDVTSQIYVFGDHRMLGIIGDDTSSVTIIGLGVGYRIGPNSEIFIGANRINTEDSDGTGVTIGASFGFGPGADRAFGLGAARALESL